MAHDQFNVYYTVDRFGVGLLGNFGRDQTWSRFGTFQLFMPLELSELVRFWRGVIKATAKVQSQPTGPTGYLPRSAASALCSAGTVKLGI